MSQNRKLTSLVSVVSLFALTGTLVAACGDDGGGGGGSCGEIGVRVAGLTASADALVDLAGTIKVDSPGALLRGEVEREWRHCQINTFGGGVNEIQREIIAMLGLGLPRAPR